MNPFRIAGTSTIAVLALWITGCALEVAPSPPSLHIPTPVKNLAATRAGDTVTLQWTMPRGTTDKALLKGDQHVTVCRNVGSSKCQSVARLLRAPKMPAGYVDHLPQALDSGAPHVLTYHIELFSPAKKSAGLSNPAAIVAGTPPPPVGPVALTDRNDGIVMHWRPQSPEPGLVMRIRRTLVEQPHAPKPNATEGAGLVPEQVLEVDIDKSDPGQAIDRDAALDHTYRYILQRVLKVKLDKTTLELPGEVSPPVTIDAKNVFPPAAPQDLQAIADEQSEAIDLSWAPGTEADVVGYIVYRREADQPGAWTRISPQRPLLAEPAYHDADVKPGVRYVYAVSAVNRDGNVSPRSVETEEELPAPQS